MEVNGYIVDNFLLLSGERIYNKDTEETETDEEEQEETEGTDK